MKMKTPITAILTTTILLFSHGAHASDERSPASYTPPGSNTVDRDKLLPTQSLPAPEEKYEHFSETWKEQRAKLSDLGLDLALIYKGELNSSLNGSLKKDSVYQDNLDLRLLLSGEKLLGVKGFSFFLYGLGNQHNTTATPSENIGNIQVTSNIENAENGFKLYEMWAQQTFMDEKLSFLLGLHDLNSEFYVSDSASLFLNSSFGVGAELAQTGTFGPSIFPNTSLAFRVRAEVSEKVYLMAAVFNAVADDPVKEGTQIRGLGADGLLSIFEAGYIAKTSESTGKYAVGMWGYDVATEELEDPTQKSRSQGAYLVAEQTFNDTFSVFLKYGMATTKTNPLASNLVLGTTYKGLIPSRADDRIGFGVTKAVLGSEYKTLAESAGDNLTGHETVLELTYRVEVVPGFALQPDYQYILSPEASKDRKDAQAAALRAEISF